MADLSGYGAYLVPLGSHTAGLSESDAKARIQLMRAFFSLLQKLRIFGELLSFLLRMNPLKKGHPGFLGKLRNRFLNFLDGAHRT